ncbi:hypothetical protein REPUB_Repub19eG0031900 [Reevesia pubescens]
MDSDEDLELVSLSNETSSPVQERKLKRLKKLKTVTDNPSQFETLDLDMSDGQTIEDPKSGSGSGSESGFEGSEKENELTYGFDELNVEEENLLGSVVKRTLDFDSITEEVEGNGEYQSQEMEIKDLEREESEKKRPSFDELESKEKKRKKRVNGVGDEEMPMLRERRTAKAQRNERREHLAQLRAESQRLLRDTRDAAFKPAPIVQKPISSILEKIRRRKLEVSKKAYFVVNEHDGNSSEDMVELGLKDVANEGIGNDRAVEVESEKEISNHGISDTLFADEIKNVVDVSSHENLSPQIAVGEEPKQAFRAPVNDTQDLFSDSQTSDSKDEVAEETPSSPLEEVLAPSLLALNLKLDSAPPDDILSDEEDNNKEYIDPQPHESVDLSATPNGDPVKAFVEEEAEEEDDSDNDLLRFQDDDNEEDEDSEDLEELRDMIATGYEEKQSDIERRMELHQKLLDQQDAAKTEHLLRKWGPKQSETTLLDEEGFEEDDEYDEDEDDDEDDFLETTEDLPQLNLRMHIKKIKEMIPQMFIDKDDMYISSDDEEAEKKLVEQCLSEKANQRAEILPPTEDARSKELFGYIKKVNNIPDTRRKAKTSSFSNMLFMGKKRNVSSKSSFIGRGSNCSIPSSRKHGSGILRSFVFEREDNNSKSTNSMAENSSDVIQKENRPTKTASAKFSNSQIKSSSQPRKDEMETSSRAQLLEILRRSSLQTNHCTRNTIVGHTESIFAAFKLEKKSIGNKANVSIKTL